MVVEGLWVNVQGFAVGVAAADLLEYMSLQWL